MKLFKLPWYIAKRYLFSKKSNNLINVISGISITGVTLSTAALVFILSIFNGFEQFISTMFSDLDPHLRITVKQGKVFDANTAGIEEIKKLDGVVYGEFLEEQALLKYDDRQLAVIVKGVDENFSLLSDIKACIEEGSFLLKQASIPYAVIGVGVSRELRASPQFITPLEIHAPQRKISAAQALRRPDLAFQRQAFVLSGIFKVRQVVYDEQYIFIDKELAQDLFDYQGMLSGIELKVSDEQKLVSVKEQVRAILGEDFLVEDRYEQQKDFFQMLQLEKWMAYLLMAFVLIIATFNVVGTLSMLVVDKQKDIQILNSMGADYGLIRRIFLIEGWATSLLGAVLGLLLGAVLCLLQMQYGFIALPEGGFMINHYPIAWRLSDFLLVGITVSVIGFFAAYYPVKYIFKRYGLR